MGIRPGVALDGPNKPTCILPRTGGGTHVAALASSIARSHRRGLSAGGGHGRPPGEGQVLGRVSAHVYAGGASDRGGLSLGIPTAGPYRGRLGHPPTRSFGSR